MEALCPTVKLCWPCHYPEISITIGEQEIDRQTGEWMGTWSNMTTTDSQKFGFWDMIGKVDGYSAADIEWPFEALLLPLQLADSVRIPWSILTFNR
jgi:hypothetical protein